MFVLAHAGITLGVTVLAGNVVKNQNKSKDGVIARLAALYEHIDLRILLIGSLLPDIIDKPIGGFFFREQLSNGRVYAHTLLFLIILTVVGIWLYRSRGSIWMLVLAFGTLIHHILDQIWLMPKTMLWPVLGFEFERITSTDWLSLWLSNFFSRPGVFIPELIGLGILLVWGIILVGRKKVGAFLRYGKIS
jgi:hypothetical protein